MPLPPRGSRDPWHDLCQAVRTAVWHRPLVACSVAVLAGLAWADRTVPPLAWLVGLGLVAGVLALVSLRLSRVAARAFALVTLFLLGAALHVHRLTPGPHDLVHLSGQTVPEATAVVLTPAWDANLHTGVDRALVTVGPWRGLAALSLPPPGGEPLPEVGDCLRLQSVTLRQSPSDERWRWRERVFTGAEAMGVTRCGREPTLRAALAGQALALNRRFLRVLTEAMPGSNAAVYAGLLSSMVFGQSAAPVSGPLKGLFRASGTTHLLVVSGAQVSLIAVTLLFLGRGRRRYLPLAAVPVLLLGLVAFAVLVGAGVSVNRAVVMQALLLLSLALGRSYDVPTALALSALGLSLADTSAPFAVGPQLTFACTLGLYLACPWQNEARPAADRVQVLYDAAWGSLGAWLFSLPVLASWFHQGVLLGALANLLAVPLASLLLYVGILAVALGALWSPLAVPLCYAARGLLEALIASNAFFAGLPGAVVPVSQPPALALAVWYAGLLALYLALRARRERREHLRSWRWPAVALVLAAGLVVLSLGWRHSRQADWELHLLDVGAGQCALLRTPARQWLALDAGAGFRGADPEHLAERYLLAYLAAHRVRRLEALVLSHAHADHCGLAAPLLAALPVAQVLTGPDLGAGDEWRALLAAARRRGVSPQRFAAGGVLRLGSDGTLTCLEPTRLIVGTGSDANNNSLVLRLALGRVSCLLPADIEAEGEARLLGNYAATPALLRSTVLVAGHHGSHTSSSPALLRAVDPQVVLLSSSAQALDWQPLVPAERGARPVPVWRTDTQGTLVLRADGESYAVQGSK